MESRPQNPEFSKNPENFYPFKHTSGLTSTKQYVPSTFSKFFFKFGGTKMLPYSMQRVRKDNRFYHMLQNLSYKLQISKVFEYTIVNIFFSLSLNISFKCSKDSSH